MIFIFVLISSLVLNNDAKDGVTLMADILHDLCQEYRWFTNSPQSRASLFLEAFLNISKTLADMKNQPLAAACCFPGTLGGQTMGGCSWTVATTTTGIANITCGPP